MRAILFGLLMSLLLPVAFVSAQPAAPTNLTASQQNWRNFIYVHLSWQYNQSSHARKTNFNIYKKDGAVGDSGSFRRIYTRVPMSEWNDRFVQKGETYSYYVTAMDRNTESIPSDTIEISIDTVTVRAVVTGSLKDEATGEALINGKITFIPVFGWGMKHIKVDSFGNFSADISPGTYLIYAKAGGYFPEYYDNVRHIFEAQKIDIKSGDSLNFDIQLSAVVPPVKYTLSGNVSDSLGNPLKAVVSAYNLSHNAFHRMFHRTVTDSSGNYSIPVRGGDTVVVFARSFDHKYIPELYNDKSDYMEADRIGISGDTSGIDFVLSSKSVYDNGIAGTVQDTDNIGVQSIVCAIRLGTDHQNHRRKYSTESDSLGVYSFTHLIPGNYIMMAIPQGDYKPTYFKYDGTNTLRWKEADSVDVSESSIISGIDFTVQAIPDSGAAAINGHVVDNNGEPVQGAIVYAQDDNGQVYSFGVTNMNGDYSIAGLVPGSYSVGPEKYGYNIAQSSTVSLDYTSTYSSDASFTMSVETVTGVKENNTVAADFRLNQNYPNPFNPTTVISYYLPSQSKVVLKVYNILGSEVATLVSGQQTAGIHSTTFNASQLASGVYFYQLKAGDFVSTKKLILMK